MSHSVTESIAARGPNAPARRTLAILGYHKIGQPPRGGWESWYYVPEPVFVRQLGDLHERGFQVIDGPGLQRALDGDEDLPDRAALLTFDDGFGRCSRSRCRCSSAFDTPP